jgi:hypothetical protein
MGVRDDASLGDALAGRLGIDRATVSGTLVTFVLMQLDQVRRMDRQT